MNECCLGETKRDTIGSQSMRMLENVKVRLEDLSSRLAGKLHPIMSSPQPMAEECGKIGQEFPPLFDEIRTRCNQMNESMDLIEDCLARTEL